jgi:hypothetical protein
MLILVFLATAALATPVAWTHEVTIAHGGTRATASYRALPDITTRQVGMTAGTRPGNVRCDWTAAIGVERRLLHADKPATSVRQLAAMKTLKGSRPGDCSANRRTIERDIASRSDAINAYLLRVAEQDQRELRAEIDTLAAPTGR